MHMNFVPPEMQTVGKTAGPNVVHFYCIL